MPFLGLAGIATLGYCNDQHLGAEKRSARYNTKNYRTTPLASSKASTSMIWGRVTALNLSLGDCSGIVRAVVIYT